MGGFIAFFVVLLSAVGVVSAVLEVVGLSVMLLVIVFEEALELVGDGEALGCDEPSEVLGLGEQMDAFEVSELLDASPDDSADAELEEDSPPLSWEE